MIKKISAKSSLENLIVNEDTKQQILYVIDYLNSKNRIYGEWGLNNDIKQSVNIFFSGRLGTGKTMAASVIASRLNLELYKIDLSNVVSKFIGETEKNIDRIFSEFQNNNAILFFDEADALFGKRTEISDSHDRYANIESNYFLQKLEEHNGIVILASNLTQKIDDVFERRMMFWIEFPYPTQKRIKIRIEAENETAQNLLNST